MRTNLIDRLRSYYPYPRSFYASKSIFELQGMLSTAQAKASVAQPLIKPHRVYASEPSYKYQNGRKYIRLDNGTYQELEDE